MRVFFVRRRSGSGDIMLTEMRCRRREDVARKMAAVGYPHWCIRSAICISQIALERALTDQPTPNLWGVVMQQKMRQLAREAA